VSTNQHPSLAPTPPNAYHYPPDHLHLCNTPYLSTQQFVGLLHPEGNTITWNIGKYLPTCIPSNPTRPQNFTLKIYKHFLPHGHFYFNGICLKRCTQLPYILNQTTVSCGTHIIMFLIKCCSQHQHTCALHTADPGYKNQPQDHVPYEFPQSLPPNYGIATS
jgi:hypothetical protein